MGSAALPGGARQGRADSGHEPLVGVGGHELHAGEPARAEAPEERKPAGPGLLAAELHAQDLAVAGGVHAGGYQNVELADATLLAHAADQRVGPAEAVWTLVQRAVAKGIDHLVQGFGHLRDLTL